MNYKVCRNCSYPTNESCTHLQCQGAHQQGFCSVDCRTAYHRIKEYELNLEATKMDQERRIANG